MPPPSGHLPRVPLLLNLMNVDSMEAKQRQAITESRRALGVPRLKTKQLEALYTYIVSSIVGAKGSIVVGVSPLTSLMMDQQHKFSPLGLCTEYVCGTQNHAVKAKLTNGEVQLVFISPESLITNKIYRQMLLSNSTSLL